jgi:hypothetical protein
VAWMRLKDVPAPLEVRYHGGKLHHVITVNVINIAKDIEATKITSRRIGLNDRQMAARPR